MKYGEPFNPFGMFRGIFLPNCVAMSDISDRAKLLLGRLYQYAGENGKAYPTIQNLAINLCWSKSKVDRAIKDLKDCGLLETFKEDEQSPSHYIFIYSPLYENKPGGHVIDDVRGHVTCDVYKEKEKIKEKTFSKEKESDSKESKRSKLKIRNKDNSILAKDGTRPTLKRKNKTNSIREKAKEFQNKEKTSPPLYIPKRTLSALEYWNNQSCLPRIIVNPENPSKTLKRVVKYIGQFFSGKLFTACTSVIPKKFCKEIWTELLQMKSEIDLKNFIDTMVDTVECGEYFIPKCLNIETFLVGSKNTKTRDGETFLTPSILISHCFLEPDKLHKLEELNPVLTNKLIKLWDKMIRDNSEEFDRDEFIKASNNIHKVYDSLGLTNKIELSTSGIYFGEVALAQRVRMMNEWRFEKRDIHPKVFYSDWFSEKAKEVKSEFMGAR